MYSHILTKLDLAKNEALIYETLLERGQSSVSTISLHSKIHRRNVYDSLNRLMEKGFVFEIAQRNENQYHAVDPRKLMEHVKEKEILLEKIMPDLTKLYNASPSDEAVYIYKGVEGWKNYLSDVLSAGEDLYTIGGKGAWGDKRLQPFMDNFLKEAKKKKIVFHALYDGEKKDIPESVLATSKGHHKFLPKAFANSSVIEIFGDRIVIFSNVINRQIDENATLTVIVNKSIADSFRIWFKMIWSFV